MSNYERGFTEGDIERLYNEIHMDNTSIKVIRRYKTKEGHMALVYLYNTYCLFFILDNYFGFEQCTLGHALSIDEIGAIQTAEKIAQIIGGTQL